MIGIMPPWRWDTWYLSERAQVANWHAVLQGRIHEWKERMEAMVGKVGRGISAELLIEQMDRNYNSLREEHIAKMTRKYGANFLISKKQYSYPVLFDSGSDRVYSLDGAGGLRVGIPPGVPVEETSPGDFIFRARVAHDPLPEHPDLIRFATTLLAVLERS